MAFLTIPIRNDIPAYRFQIELESVLYFMEFRYSERSERWFFDIYDSDENIIIGGIKILNNQDLTGRFKNQSLPPGTFFTFDESGNDAPPSRTNFGQDIVMLYRESTT